MSVESHRYTSTTITSALPNSSVDDTKYREDKYNDDNGEGDGGFSVSSIGNSARTSMYDDDDNDAHANAPPRFLVVDDHNQTRKILRRVFDMKGR